MIEEIISAFSLKRDINVSPDEAAFIIEAAGNIIDVSHVKDGRLCRLPLRLASGDPVGDYIFVAMTVLDTSISIAIDSRPSITPIFGSTFSKIVGICDPNLLICKIKKQDLNYRDFVSICLIKNGIPNFRARCEEIVAYSESSFNEIKRFLESKNFNINVSLSKDEDKSMYHKFTFANEDGNISIEDSSLFKAMVKMARSLNKSVSSYSVDPFVVDKMVVSVEPNTDGVSEMLRYKSGGNKLLHLGSKVVAKPTNLMKSKIVGTVIGKSGSIINVKWDAGNIKYDLNNPKTYFLLEFVD
jgi:hypothetical protein